MAKNNLWKNSNPLYKPIYNHFVEFTTASLNTPLNTLSSIFNKRYLRDIPSCGKIGKD